MVEPLGSGQIPTQESIKQEDIQQAVFHSMYGEQPADNVVFVQAPQIAEGAFLKKPLELEPQQSERTLRERASQTFHSFGEVARAGYEDYKHDPNKLAAGALAGATVVTQAIDRLRLVLIYGPRFATEVYQQTNNSFLGGLAVAGIFAAANLTTGEVLTQSMDRFPKAKEEFKEEFPKTIQIFSDSLAGVETKEITSPEDDLEGSSAAKPESSDKIRTTLKKISLPLKRAMAGIGLGSTAFVATSSVNGHDKKEVRKVNLQVTRDTSLLIMALGTGILEGIENMQEQGWHDAAEIADSIVSDGRTWYGVAAASIIWTYIANRRAAKKIDQEAQKEPQSK